MDGWKLSKLPHYRYYLFNCFVLPFMVFISANLVANKLSKSLLQKGSTPTIRVPYPSIEKVLIPQIINVIDISFLLTHWHYLPVPYTVPVFVCARENLPPLCPL